MYVLNFTILVIRPQVVFALGAIVVHLQATMMVQRLMATAQTLIGRSTPQRTSILSCNVVVCGGL